MDKSVSREKDAKMMTVRVMLEEFTDVRVGFFFIYKVPSNIIWFISSGSN